MHRIARQKPSGSAGGKKEQGALSLMDAMSFLEPRHRWCAEFLVVFG